MAFARAGRGGGFTYTPAPQRSYMNLVKSEAFKAMNGLPPWRGPIELVIEFRYAYPKSWSQKRLAEKRLSELAWKTTAPDIDNLIKIIADSLTKIVFVDDAQVFYLRATKCYAAAAGTKITIKEMETA